MNFEYLVYILGIIVFAYLIGSIPTAYIMCKTIAGIDIREEGSGNVGANNTKRVIGKVPALFVLIIDILKGVVPVLVGLYIQTSMNIFTEWSILPVLAAFFAIFGHSKSIFINFTGGKGAATGLGTILILCWPVALIVIGMSILTAKFSKFQSMGVLIVVPFSAILMLIFNQPISYAIYCIVVSLYLLYLFRSNIKTYFQKLHTS